MVTGTITVRLENSSSEGGIQRSEYRETLPRHLSLFRQLIPLLTDKGLNGIQLETRFESRCEQIETVLSFVEAVLHKAHLIPADQLSRVMLVIHEAVSNAVYHGNLRVPQQVRSTQSFPEYESELNRSKPELLERTVDLNLNVRDTDAEILVSDCGGGFDYQRELSRKHPPDPDRETGRGIFLLKQTVDEMEFRDNGETIYMKMTWRDYA